MAKITVYFKDKVVQSGLFDSGIIHIGRDQTNDLVIDSLAVAPVHAALSIQKAGNSIKQLTEDFPIIVNGEKIKESVLVNNDTLTIGKHDIFFQCTSVNEITTPKVQVNDREYNDVLSLNKEISNIINIPEANFQVMAGTNIGKLIPITNTIMRLGHSGSGVVVIEKQSQAYLISLLKNKGSITLNNQSLNEDKLKINHLDILVIDNTPLQFFLS
jgi:hypothetical protein